ncbi:MAG: hypothetical protein KC910_17465, partial [Candidatus Eremiobacteraeota bacterium]|nr:hypothetical protein [Candidatus Eremiobacteraeota bacterium]
DGGRGGDDRLVVRENGNRTRIVDDDGKVLYQSQGWTEGDSQMSIDRVEQFTVYRDDGSFARWDEDKGLRYGQDPPSTADITPVQAARVLRDNMDYLDTAAGIGEADGIVGRNDLEAMRNNPKTSPELRGTIDYLLQNDAVWRSMDASGAGSNRINLEGLNNYIDRFETSPGFTDGPMNDRRAAQVLSHYMPILDTAQSQGNNNGVFSLDDARTLLRDNPGAPPELRAAAQHLLDSASLRSNLDTAGWSMKFWSDDQYSTGDLDAYLGR